MVELQKSCKEKMMTSCYFITQLSFTSEWSRNYLLEDCAWIKLCEIECGHDPSEVKTCLLECLVLRVHKGFPCTCEDSFKKSKWLSERWVAIEKGLQKHNIWRSAIFALLHVKKLQGTDKKSIETENEPATLPLRGQHWPAIFTWYLQHLNS